jgi:hypothetical protein
MCRLGCLSATRSAVAELQPGWHTTCCPTRQPQTIALSHTGVSPRVGWAAKGCAVLVASLQLLADCCRDVQPKSTPSYYVPHLHTHVHRLLRCAASSSRQSRPTANLTLSHPMFLFPVPTNPDLMTLFCPTHTHTGCCAAQPAAEGRAGLQPGRGSRGKTSRGRAAAG